MLVKVPVKELQIERTLAVNLLGYWLRDALNPRLK